MLASSTEPPFITGFKYVCPIARYKRLDRNYPRYPINLDFYACPLRFAQTYHYVNDGRLETALENYRTKSATRGDYTISRTFVEEVRRLCYDYQQGLAFKRDIVEEKDSDNEEDIQPKKRGKESSL